MSPRIKSILVYSAAIGGLAAAVACSTGPKSGRVPASSADASQDQGPVEPKIPPIIDVADMKDGRDGRAAVDPCVDFYQYACGTWLDKTEIPADKAEMSRRFTSASDAVDVRLNRILAAYSRGDFSVPSKYAAKLSDFYNSCLAGDQQSADALQIVKKKMALIRKMKSKKDKAHTVAALKKMGVHVLFSFYSEQDPANSSKVVGMIGQSGMGLATRDYYYAQDEKSEETRVKYKAYIAQLFTLLGETPANAEKISGDIFNFEKALADKAFLPVDLQDIDKTNHPVNQSGLSKISPHFDWKTYFTDLGVGSLQDLNVRVIPFMSAEDKLVQATPNEVLANYFIARFVDSNSEEIGGAFAEAKFDFRGKYLSGAKEREPLWKRCTGATSAYLDYPMSDAYIQTFDGQKIRERADAVIAETKTSFAENLEIISQGSDAWLEPQSLVGAKDKLKKISKKVGAPSKIPDYMPIRVSASSYLQNALNVAEFSIHRDLAKIGKPVDKNEWDMMPWMINAYYAPSENEFVFPFGILQPPSFDETANDAINFGAFGMIVGHELTHGFDANGSKYDANGNLKNWWDKETAARFKERSQCFVDQANAYHVEQTNLNVNGKLVIDENLADHGGIKFGYRSLERLMKNRAAAPNWNGFNERQQYWIAFGQGWCEKQTLGRARQQMLTNEHPLSEFRVNQVLRNQPEFAKDFNCKVGSPMAPVKKCSLW